MDFVLEGTFSATISGSVQMLSGEKHESSTLLDTVDSLLADLNDAIYELREEEESSKPLAPHTKIVVEREFPSRRPYTGPKDKTMASVSTLPDAFGGWLHKATYNLFKTRSLKKRYIVLANCSIYMFSSDDPLAVYDDQIIITSDSNVRVAEKGIYALTFSTDSSLNRSSFGDKTHEFQCAVRHHLILG